MTPDELLRLHLPKDLSPETEDALFESLKGFPKLYYERFYSGKLQRSPDYLQGDGVGGLLLFNLPSTESRPGPGMILSNTCDISPENKRYFRASVCYAPIFNLEKYRGKLAAAHGQEAASSHVEAIRNQRITQLFFLPKGGALADDSFIHLDQIISLPVESLPNDPPKGRLFSLSQYGHYLFLLKLSIHFCRMNDRLDRGI